VRIDGPVLLLKPQIAQAIGVALHELATNAAKYGSLSVSQGSVEVTWSCATNGQFILRWTKRNGPPVKAPRRQGFGTQVIGRIIREQKGEMRLDWDMAGLRCEIVLPYVG
jgi:two-component sensor histidine kinase